MFKKFLLVALYAVSVVNASDDGAKKEVTKSIWALPTLNDAEDFAIQKTKDVYMSLYKDGSWAAAVAALGASKLYQRNCARGLFEKTVWALPEAVVAKVYNWSPYRVALVNALGFGAFGRRNEPLSRTKAVLSSVAARYVVEKGVELYAKLPLPYHVLPVAVDNKITT